MDGHELIAAVTRDAYQAVSVGPEAAGPSVRATYNPTRGGRYNSNRGHMVVRGGPHHHALGLQQNYYPAPYGQTPAPFFPPDPATSGMVYYGIRQPDQYHDPSNFIGPPIQHPNGFPPNLNHPHTPRGRAPRRPRGPGPGGPPRGHHHRPHHPGPPPDHHHHGPPPDHHRGPRSGPPGHRHDHRHGPPDNSGPTEHFRPPQQHHAPSERTNAFPDYDPPSYETAMSQSAPPSADNRRYDNGGDSGHRSSTYNRGGGGGNRSNQYHHNHQQQQQQQYPPNNQRRWTQPVGRGGSSSGGARRDAPRDAPMRPSLARQPEDEDYESTVYDKKKYQERERGGSGGGPVASGREQQPGQRSSSWRSDPPTPKKKLDPLKKKDAIVGEDDRTQRERLTDEMVRGKCECVVCCDFMLPSHEVWSCPNCYNIFHLKCIKKWATAPSEIEDRSWRCPCCQNVTTNFPQRYMCFCGKRANPAINHYDTPHSCGEQCGRRRKAENCHHYCNIQCHPGPCPPCGVYVDQKCPCGAKSEKVRCGQSRPISCGEPCKYYYDCGTHKCKGKCHMGYCGPCDIMVVKKCFCGRQELEESCSGLPEDSLFFACGTACGRTLNCGLHTCQRLCHADDCGPCVLAPELVTRCPCGQTELADMGPDGQRALCTDSVPVCGLICNKELLCGDEGEPPHRCQATCHSGQCPPCPLTALLRCRCGSATVEKLCASLTSSDTTTSTTTGEGEKSDATTALVECAKRCTKKRSCGRHKCNKRCCTDTAHQCEQTCGRKLTCGLHTCEEPCHLGNCHNCWNTSFDELTCYCGATVLYPPIPCGTRPPICSKPCSRQHGCEHAVQHKCHSDSQCPPCTNLTSKWCYGNHELRTCIPCFRTDVSCGMPCKKPLPCGRHTCILTCHSGSCSVGSGGGAGAEDAVALACSQPCTRPRPKCEHPCAAACHDGECPVTHCKATVAVTCKCGHRTGTKSCVENQQIYQRLVSAAIAVKTHNLEGGQTVDITDAIKDVGLKKNCTLDCSSDCALIDRNRRLALALQIRNPELTNKLKPPAYSDFLKDQVRQVPAFVASIHDKLTELVQSAKQSKQKSRSHAFPPMKSVNRRVIHELSEFFGCDTQSYDEEPKKNVVATAFRDKSFLPSTSVMTVVQKEMGILRTAGKAPPPPSRRTQGSFGNFTSLSGIGASAPANNSPATSLSGTTVVAPVANHWASAATNSSATSSNASFFNVAGNNTASGATNSAPIDYFDYNG